MKTKTIIIMMLLFCFILSGNNQNNTNFEETLILEEENKNLKEKNKINKTQKIITNSEVKELYKITIDNITYLKNNNLDINKQTTQTFAIELSYENIAKENGLFISDMNFSIYDASNKKVDVYLIEKLSSSGKIMPGENTSKTIAFSLNHHSNEIEIEFFDNMLNPIPDAFWKATIGNKSEILLTTKKTPTKKSQLIKNNKINSYKIIKNSKNESLYVIKIDSIKFIDDRNLASNKIAYRVFEIEFSYENIAKKNGLAISDLYFNVYDASGQKLETYPAGRLIYGGKITPGRNTIGTMTFALNHDSNEIVIEFFDNILRSKPDFTWKGIVE